jgi:phospho-N-acetylmuramoyl-pentapeptide-transferase
LALGGALASVAIYTNSFWVLFGMGGLFFVESVSVLLQVGYYKATKGADGVGKRLFKMAPYHHHLELSGWSEMQVVSTFYGVTLVLVLVCLGLPR